MQTLEDALGVEFLRRAEWWWQNRNLQAQWPPALWSIFWAAELRSRFIFVHEDVDLGEETWPWWICSFLPWISYKSSLSSCRARKDGSGGQVRVAQAGRCYRKLTTEQGLLCNLEVDAVTPAWAGRLDSWMAGWGHTCLLPKGLL